MNLFKNKYLKYKNKYFELKKLIAGMQVEEAAVEEAAAKEANTPLPLPLSLSPIPLSPHSPHSQLSHDELSVINDFLLSSKRPVPTGIINGHGIEVTDETEMFTIIPGGINLRPTSRNGCVASARGEAEFKNRLQRGNIAFSALGDKPELKYKPGSLFRNINIDFNTTYSPPHPFRGMSGIITGDFVFNFPNDLPAYLWQHYGIIWNKWSTPIPNAIKEIVAAIAVSAHNSKFNQMMRLINNYDLLQTKINLSELLKIMFRVKKDIIHKQSQGMQPLDQEEKEILETEDYLFIVCRSGTTDIDFIPEIFCQTPSSLPVPTLLAPTLPAPTLPVSTLQARPIKRPPPLARKSSVSGIPFYINFIDHFKKIINTLIEFESISGAATEIIATIIDKIKTIAFNIINKLIISKQDVCYIYDYYKHMPSVVTNKSAKMFSDKLTSFSFKHSQDSAVTTQQPDLQDDDKLFYDLDDTASFKSFDDTASFKSFDDLDGLDEESVDQVSQSFRDIYKTLLDMFPTEQSIQDIKPIEDTNPTKRSKKRSKKRSS